MRSGGIVVVGIGNPSRGDDGAGRAVAERLKGTLPDGVAVVAHDGEAASLLDCIEGAGTAIFVDACVSGAPAGTVRRVDLQSEDLPDLHFGLSTHGFGLGEAIALGKALGNLPPRCLIFAIEAVSFETGDGLSSAVVEAVDIVAETVRNAVMQHA